MGLLLLGFAGIAGVVLYFATASPKASRAERNARFQDALGQAFLALDKNDIAMYKAALATASAQLDVKRGPTLTAEQPLGHYQAILYNPQGYSAKEILSFAGSLQAQGHDFEAGNLILLEMNLVR